MSDNKDMSFLSWRVFVFAAFLIVSITMGSFFVVADHVSAKTFYQLYDPVLDEVIGAYDSDTECRLMERQLGKGECIPFEMNIGDEEDGQEENVTTWKLVRSETGEVLFDGFLNIGMCGEYALELYPGEDVQCVKSDAVITPKPDTDLDDMWNTEADTASSNENGNILDRFRDAITAGGQSSNTSGSQGSSDGYILLEPSIIGQSGDTPVTPADYLYGIFWFMIGAAGVLAVLVFAIGGIQFMTSGVISQKKDGQEKMTAAIFGLLLALGAWLILNTINPDFVNFDLKLDTVTVSGNPGAGTNTEGSVEYEGYELCNPDGTVAGARYSDKETCEKNIPEGSSQTCQRQCPGSEEQAGTCNAPSSHKQWLNASCEYTKDKEVLEFKLRLEYARDHNIAFNNNPCTKPTQKSGCTDIVGMKSATEAELFRIADAMRERGKGVTLTGGTEVDSHAIGGKSHPNGYKFDLRLDSSEGGLDEYIMGTDGRGANGFVRLDSCSHGSSCYRRNGITYYRESNHWDVLVP